MCGVGVPAASHSKRTVFAVGNTCESGARTKCGAVATRRAVVRVTVTLAPRSALTPNAEHV